MSISSSTTKIFCISLPPLLPIYFKFNGNIKEWIFYGVIIKLYKIIKHYYIELLQNYKEFIFNQYTKEVGAQMEANKSIIEKLGVQITTLSPAFVLSLARPLDEFEKQDFESCFEHVKSVFYCD